MNLARSWQGDHADMGGDSFPPSSGLAEVCNPLDFLLPYQLAWALDTSRFKIWLAARQVGKSFACAFEVVLDAIESGQDWIVLSRGERQAKDFVLKVAMIADVVDKSLVVSQHVEQVREHSSLVLTFRNGATIRGLPANADTARGYSGNVVLDEFAFHERPADIWRAVFPIISNPISGLKKLRIMSTPKGKNSKFYDLWSSDDGRAGAMAWSRHKTTIYDAQAAGLAVDITQLKENMDDPDGWAQEFAVEFLEASTQYFPTSLVESCISNKATDCGDLFSRRSGARFGGLDIGRHRDLSVLFSLHENDKRELITEEVLTMAKMAFEEQQRLTSARIPRYRRFALDASGLGEETGERLQTRFGEAKVECCKFTNEFKNRIFPGLKSNMQRGRILLPDVPAITEDLLKIEKQVTQGGTIRYLAAHTRDGHADITNSLALCVYAATESVGAWTLQKTKSTRVPPRSPFAVNRLRF